MVTTDQLRLRLAAEESMHPDDIGYFVARFDRYSHLAQAPTSVKPPSVPGRHMSVRLRKGWRLWGFQHREVRDKFLREYDEAQQYNV